MILLGVVGASVCSPAIESMAYEVGYEVAARGAGLVCGGLGGVVQAACRGAREAGGITIGILPGRDARHAVGLALSRVAERSAGGAVERPRRRADLQVCDGVKA